jgi:hypothetical protein
LDLNILAISRSGTIKDYGITYEKELIFPTRLGKLGPLRVPLPNEPCKVLDMRYPKGWRGKHVYKDPWTGRVSDAPKDIQRTILPPRPLLRQSQKK